MTRKKVRATSLFFILFFTAACAGINNQSKSNELKLSRAQDELAAGKTIEAKQTLLDLCDHSYGPGCSILGGVFHQAREASYLEFYRKGCDLKDGLGCFGLASQNYRKHENDLFQKHIQLSCLYGFQEACRVVKQINQDNLKAIAE